MQLNQKQLQILKTVDEHEPISSEPLEPLLEDFISQRLNFPVENIRCDIKKLENYDYFMVVRWRRYQQGEKVEAAVLSDKGKAAINIPEDFMIQPNSTIPMTNNISISSSVNSPINILQNADNNNVSITQNIDQNIAEVIKSLEQLKQTIQTLPTDEKEDAEDFLHYIQEEIEKPSNQRDESKITKNFKRFCKIAFPFVLGGIINGVDFTNNVTDLATKFNVELPQLPMIK